MSTVKPGILHMAKEDDMVSPCPERTSMGLACVMNDSISSMYVHFIKGKCQAPQPHQYR